MALTDCALCGRWDVTGNGIGNAGAAALAKALESGQCKLTRVDLYSESRVLACVLPPRLRLYESWP